jgi:hypothetical protein
LFNKFDSNKSGRIDFEEFAGWVALKGSGNNPNVNPVFGLTREPPHTVLDKIRQVLKARGMLGIRGLINLFKRFDSNLDSKLDRHEAQWVLKENGHTLSPSEFERIFKYFDKNNDGFISISEFIRGIRGDLSAYRLSVVKDVFEKIAPSGEISVDDLLARFDLKTSDAYRNGEKSAKEVLSEVADLFD